MIPNNDATIGRMMQILFTLFNEFKAAGDYCSPSSLVAEENKFKKAHVCMLTVNVSLN